MRLFMYFRQSLEHQPVTYPCFLLQIESYSKTIKINLDCLLTKIGGAMACRFLQAKWYDLEAKMGPGSINFAKVISAITQYGATKFDYDEVCFNWCFCSLATHSITIIN